jgi:hypothetical protein
MVLSYYHFTNIKGFLLPTDDPNKVMFPPEGLIPGMGHYGDWLRSTLVDDRPQSRGRGD